MRTTKRSASEKKFDASNIAPVKEIELGNYASLALKAYGTEVNEDRSIPSLQDGLKPVQRRAVWAASKIAREYTKAARLVGETLGRFHPHGDASAWGAIVKIATSDVPMLEGRGNWGNLVDNAAAMRYPEVRLAAYGRHFVSPNYLAVTPMTPNYDDKDVEPIHLPSLLPNILLNSQSGIGYGLQTSIPGFTPDTLLPLLCRLLDKEKLEPIDYAKALKFNSSWGAVVAKNKLNREAILQLMTQPNASIIFESPLEIDREKKQIVLSKFAPELNIETLIAKVQGRVLSKSPTKRQLDDAKWWKTYVQGVSSGKGLSYIIRVKRTCNFNEFDNVVEEFKKLTTTKVSFNINVSDRQALGDGKYEVTFKALSVPQLMMSWLRHRVKLEVDSITYQIGETEKAIAYLELLIHACDNLDIIFAALRKPNTAELIAKGLKISIEEANQILELKVRQLSKLDQDELKNKLSETNKKLKVLQGKLKAPAKSVKGYFEMCLQKFNVQNGRPTNSQYQWWLD